jgi:phosphotransferase system enzyme I (PtsP)
VQAFAAMDDDYLSARAEDIKDLGRRILVNIQSKTRGPRHYPERTILVGEEITATVLMEVPQGKLAGVVSVKGSSTSHTAIIARAMGIPAIMGATDVPCQRLEACKIVVDGYQGLAYVDPSPTVLLEYARLKMQEYELSSELAELKGLPAITPDGFRVPLYVNLGLLAEVSSTQDGDAEGIGLYRTEFPFMIRDRFPGEDEQTHIYLQALKAFAPRPVVLRTLDIGGDKALSYFPIHEDNPFLGWRGIRVSLDHPDIFLTQIRAMLRAAAGLNNLHILLPMISNISEIEESLKYVARARDELIASGHKSIAMPKIGAMIEVPSAVYQAAAIAKRVDFISIGTNDLTQYLLAVDRNNSSVANLYDCLHPAVIQAIYYVVTNANLHKVPVSVCGEMAGDPAAAILFIGMGMDTLSMSVVALPRIKWVIRSINYKRAQELLLRALAMEDAQSVRAFMHEELDQMGLGALIGPGR